jgi:hypothetical protein
MKHLALGNAVLAVVLVLVGICVNSDTKPRMNTQSLYVVTDSESHETLRVALLSDLHVKNSPDAIAKLSELYQ